ncbi:MAG: carboxypeptidase-like regulatory domain-containing protein, partial [Minisyncoccia bacterium]
AWSQNYGWINFTCPGSACVTTDWRPNIGPPPISFVFVCSDESDNDDDGLTDEADPGCHIGYDLNNGWDMNGFSEDNPDVCTNLDGAQITMPEGYGADPINTEECVRLSLVSTMQNPNPLGGLFWSADVTTEEMSSNPTLPKADFTGTNTVKVKVEGPVSEVKFYLDGIQTGDTLTAPTSGTDIYEVPLSLSVQCSNPENHTISVEANSNTVGVLGTTSSVTITVDRAPCGTQATECVDTHLDDNGEVVGTDNDGDGKANIEDPGCWLIDSDGVSRYHPELDTENPSEDICTTTPQPLVCTEDPCLTNFIFGCSGFCEANPEDTQCLIPIPVSTCFTDPSLCTCEDNPELPGCNTPVGGGFIDPCILNPEAPGCKTPSIISGIFPPEVVAKINLGLKIATTTSATVGAVISLSTAIFLNPLSAPELVLIPVRLWSLLLTGLGLKKRRKPWGTVYDSITKQPLDPVYVSLRTLEGAEVASSITDIDGRYGFLVKPGVYKVVPRKTNYIFPSDNLSKHFRDEFYQNLYFGDYINISDEGEVIIKNIPMDPVNFDWNEFAKNKKQLYKFYSKRELLIAKISNWLFGFGFIVAGTALLVSPEKYNIIIFGLYVLMFVMRRVGFRLKAKGRVLDKDGLPLSFAFIRAFSVETNVEIAHSVSDERGRYHMIVPNGTYYVKIEKKDNDGSYSVVYTSNYFKVVHGVLNSVFNI